MTDTTAKRIHRTYEGTDPYRTSTEVGPLPAADAYLYYPTRARLAYERDTALDLLGAAFVVGVLTGVNPPTERR